MKNILLTGLALLIASPLAAQRKRPGRVVEAPSPPPQIFRYVTQMPVFPGDVATWIHSYIRYPDEAREQGYEGRVSILFEIMPDGSTQFLTFKNSSGIPALDNEVRRVFNKMPAWRPAKCNGRPIKYRMILPVVFRIGS